MRHADLARLRDYAAATGCPLKLALYWARWGLWSLIDPVDLVPAGGKFDDIDMFKAVGLSELERLGSNG